MMNFVEMGNYLLETRLRLHLSQELVADIIGVTDKTIRKIEYGVTAADLVTIMKLWDFYELPQQMLFSFYQRDEDMIREINYNQDKIQKAKNKVLLEV